MTETTCVSSTFTQTIGVVWNGGSPTEVVKANEIIETAEPSDYSEYNYGSCDHKLKMDSIGGKTSYVLPEDPTVNCADENPIIKATSDSNDYSTSLLITNTSEYPLPLDTQWFGYNVKHELSNGECSVTLAVRGAGETILARTRLSMSVKTTFGHFNGSELVEDGWFIEAPGYVRNVMAPYVCNPCSEEMGEWDSAINDSATVVVDFQTATVGNRPEEQCAFCGFGKTLFVPGMTFSIVSLDTLAVIRLAGAISGSPSLPLLMPGYWLNVEITIVDAPPEDNSAEYVQVVSCQCNCCDY